MKILVTGGCGYIGSHTCVELLNNQYEVIVIDNLSNSKKNIPKRIEKITSSTQYWNPLISPCLSFFPYYTH